MYCLREEDAILVAEGRLPRQSVLMMHVRDQRTNVETWEFWRMVP